MSDEKFKIGDKVRCINDYESYYLKNRETYVVREIEGDYLWIENFRFISSHFELIESAKQPRKHAKFIHAWADGAKIQFKNKDDKWLDIQEYDNPEWCNNYEYRIKPELKPDTVFIEYYSLGDNGDGKHYALRDKFSGTKVKFTFDGESGKLKIVKLIK